MADGDASRCQGDQRDQHSIDRGTPPSRVVQPGDQEYEGQSGKADPLEDTQRTGFKSELVLRVIRISQEGDAGNEAREIQQTLIR